VRGGGEVTTGKKVIGEELDSLPGFEELGRSRKYSGQKTGQKGTGCRPVIEGSQKCNGRAGGVSPEECKTPLDAHREEKNKRGAREKGVSEN